MVQIHFNAYCIVCKPIDLTLTHTVILAIHCRTLMCKLYYITCHVQVELIVECVSCQCGVDIICLRHLHLTKIPLLFEGSLHTYIVHTCLIQDCLLGDLL